MRRGWSAAAVAACVVAAITAPVAAAAAAARPGWSVVPVPSPAGATASFLGGVACSGAGACTAVGSFQRVAGMAALAERWNGTALTIQPVPSPASSQSTALSAVSCPAATACTAVGGYRVPSPGGYLTAQALAERWDGTAWSIQPTPSLADLPSHLQGVSCPTVSACVAVGNSISSGGGGQDFPFAESWNGSAWSREPVPFPHGAFSTVLPAVSCTGASDCIAVGSSFFHNSFEHLPLAERWDGSAWSILPVPAPAGGGELFGVSCTAATACTAVGQLDSHPGVLAERWNGTAWSIQRTPTPPGAAGVTLTAVSCPAATTCTAVGSVTNTFQNRTLAEHWNGITWSIQPTPNPPGGNNGLNAVACPTPAFCLATGSQSHRALAERFTS
jgi:hypothetical protein